MTIERGEVVKTFMELVQVKSATFHEKEMASEMVRRLREMGCNPEVDREGNILVFLFGNPAREPYMMSAHLDTVENPMGPAVNPYIDSDNWIRSRPGTILGADNKTAVAAILETIKQLKQEKNDLHHPLEIVFTVSEESGNHGAHGLNYKQLSAKGGFSFDAGGHDFGDMITASPFYNRFDMIIEGKEAHASRPDLAKNVLPVFAKALLDTDLGKINPNTIANIGVVSAGSVGGSVNTIPGKIAVSGEVRSMNEEELERTTKQIRDNFSQVASSSGVKLNFRKVRENNGFEFEQNHHLIVRASEVLKSMGVKNPKLIRSWGCYEANIFAEHGIKLINISDGSLDNHTETERIKTSDLERLRDLVYRLAVT